MHLWNDVFFDGLRMAGGYLPFSAPYLSCMYYPQNIDSAISEGYKDQMDDCGSTVFDGSGDSRKCACTAFCYKNVIFQSIDEQEAL